DRLRRPAPGRGYRGGALHAASYGRGDHRPGPLHAQRPEMILEPKRGRSGCDGRAEARAESIFEPKRGRSECDGRAEARAESIFEPKRGRSECDGRREARAESE